MTENEQQICMDEESWETSNWVGGHTESKVCTGKSYYAGVTPASSPQQLAHQGEF